MGRTESVLPASVFFRLCTSCLFVGRRAGSRGRISIFIRRMQCTRPAGFRFAFVKRHGDTSSSCLDAAFARSWALLENEARAILFKLQNLVLLPRTANAGRKIAAPFAPHPSFLRRARVYGGD